MTAPDAPPPAARRTPLWMRVVLLVSLALNLAVVGVVAGLLAGGRPDGVAAPRGAATGLYLRALPEEHREAMREGLRREGGQFRIDRAALRAETAATLAALRAEPFDAVAFAARIAQQRQTLADRVSAGDRLLVERLAAMTPEERRAYADRLEETLGRFGRGRRD